MILAAKLQLFLDIVAFFPVFYISKKPNAFCALGFSFYL